MILRNCIVFFIIDLCFCKWNFEETCMRLKSVSRENNPTIDWVGRNVWESGYLTSQFLISKVHSQISVVLSWHWIPGLQGSEKSFFYCLKTTNLQHFFNAIQNGPRNLGRSIIHRLFVKLILSWGPFHFSLIWINRASISLCKKYLLFP